MQLTPGQLADELGVSAKTLRAWLRTTWPRAVPGGSWDLTAEQIAAARQRWSDGGTVPTSAASPSGVRTAARDTSDESYVIDLLDAVLGEAALRQHRFAWLTGDPGRTGRTALLPVDAYWPGRRLVVEYRERQHDEATPFFDKTDRVTVSGVHRGEQRKIYDERREELIPTHGLRLLIIRPGQLAADSRGRLRRDRAHDQAALEQLVTQARTGD